MPGPWEKYAAQPNQPSVAASKGPWSKYSSSAESQAPTSQSQGLAERAAVDTSGASKFYPDTNISKPEMAATQVVSGITGMNASEAASQGLKDALKEHAISYAEFTKMKQDMLKENQSGNSYSQQLETVKAENPTLSAASDLTGQAINVAGTQPAFDELVPMALKAGGEALKNTSQWLGTKAIGLSEKAMTKIGGVQGAQKLGQVMDEYGLTELPRTMRKLGEKLSEAVNVAGSKLGLGYKEIDKSLNTAQTGDNVINSTFDDWMKTYKETTGIEPGKNLQTSMRNTLEDRFDPKKLYTHQDIANIATDIQKKAWDKASLDATKTDVQAGFALRRNNISLAEQSGASPELLDQVKEASSAYNKLKTAKDAIDAKLSKNPSKLSAVLSGAQHIGAAALGKPVLAADIAYTAANSAVGKTSAAAVTKLGSKLLGAAADMGKFGRVMLNVAAQRGYQGLVEWHLQQLDNNPDYAKAYEDANDQTSSQK